jgi:protein SOK2
MNQAAPDMYYQSMSAGQPSAPPTVTSSAMNHYHQQQPPLLQPGPAQYPSQGQYSQYGYGNGMPSHGNGLTSPSAAPPSVSNPMGAPQGVLPLPGVPGQQNAMQPGYAGFDTTGQHPPPGMKPRVTATLWEDEGSLCFQVEARGICVARREDNHMINGTKLLNVAGMTRGRRDGILKSEKTRHVVKIGPMHLKGVWIPYERALDFANKEKITELLYPLFVQNIGALLYHPTNQSRTSQVMAATAERRKQEQGQMRQPQPHGLPSIQQHHHNSVAVPGHQPPLPSNNMGRPSLDRAHTFPTPPTSASGVMPSMGNHESFNWQGQGMNGHQATTPPGASMQSMQPYPPASQGYDPPRHMYNAPPSQPSPYQNSTNPPQDRMYGHSGSYQKNEMGPPSSRPSASGPSGDQHDAKGPNGILPSEQTAQPHAGDDEGDHEHDAEYTHDSGAYDAARASYNYTAPGVGALANDTNLSPEMTGSPNHAAGSGRATPRTAAAPNPYYSQHPGYNTPPRVQQTTSNLYNVMSNDRPSTNGAPGNDVYAPPADMANSMSNGYAPQPPVMNGSGGMKRGRDDDDDLSRSGPDGPGSMGTMDLKRRKTLMDTTVPAPAYDSMNRPASAVGAPRRR